ncbi:MAG TPA: hypothetical protein VE967_15345 [Gemmatimonadaceae bacterium]|nr:hypothetical protein [Gemmatimonadaceae bacterium]
MTERNWDAELAKIDKRMASVSDDELLASKAVVRPAATASQNVREDTGGVTVSAPPTRWGVLLRVGLAVAVAVAVPFWPYASRCGLWLIGFLGTVAAIIVAGSWAAVSTWRARAPRLHLAALLVVAWGLTLAAHEVLPRIGYAKDEARVAWVCK